ncbi:MAG: hypothetical protein JWP01_2679 [Myxococcales bacterium]|nr:hypothetical protein [Myxococcales bacterium]
MTRFLLVAVLVIACGKDKERGEPTPAAPEDDRCQPLPFADAAPVPEASGAGWMTLDGKPALLVISDSGNGGAYAIVDAETGESRETGRLPLGTAGEDLEGLSARGELLYAITSSGWILGYRRKAGGFDLAKGPYPLGPLDLPDKGGMGDKPPEGTGMVCGQRATNCGRNYEGLCLVDAAHEKGPCIGFAASKADGHLYCVVEQEGGKLAVTYEPRIAITKPGALADCAFDDAGQLYVGSNLFDMAQVSRVDGWDNPATAKVTKIAPLGIGFPETLAARGDVIYRMSDTGGAPSLMNKFRCRR